jgi:two-component system OmpR family response regulator
MPQRILVVDDEPHIRDVICFALDKAGFATTTARNGAEAMMTLARGSVDLMVLDIGMPEMDGLDVCRQVRKSSDLPILFLSARDEEIDRILGLEIGGDDYVTKPFSPRELVARVKAILKRSGGGAAPDKALVRGDLRLDRARHSVVAGAREITLTGLEFSILEVLLARPELVFSREQLMTAAYGTGIYVADRTIDSHVRNIRAKFADAGRAAIIATVHGVGFKLSPDAK